LFCFFKLLFVIVVQIYPHIGRCPIGKYSNRTTGMLNQTFLNLNILWLI